jgi:putative acetyltransferase
MQGVIIRPETPGDIAAIYDVHLRAFGQASEARLVDELRRDGDVIPELSLVAVDGRWIVGHILFPHVSIVSHERSVPALALAPMAVLPESQRHGIGALLVREGLAACRCLGHCIVIVVGHPGYYPRFGFFPAREWGIDVPFPVPDEALMATALVEGALEGVHGTVRYPHAFDTTEE